MNTSQKAQGFFARHGFVVVETKVDGIAPGLAQVRMELSADAARRPGAGPDRAIE